jgi:hypothetical protein
LEGFGMKRILVAGSTGAGKTRLGRALAGRTAIPFHEMDALAFGGPGWRENQHLAEDVSRISFGPCWIFDTVSAAQGVTNEMLNLIPPLREQDERLPICATNSSRPWTAGYHLSKRHWNTITLDGSVPDDECWS